MSLKARAQALLNSNKAIFDEEAVSCIEAMILACDDSFDGVRATVQRAIQAAVDKENPKTHQYVYVRDMYPATAVYSLNGELFQVDYSIADNEVTLGTPVPVELSYVPTQEAVQECDVTGDIIDVTEAGLTKSVIKVIQAGQGASAFYPKEVLKRDAATAFPKGTQMFINHQSPQEAANFPVGDVSKLAGVFTGNAYWDENGADGPAVYAPIEMFTPFAGPLKDMKDHIGVSVRARGYAKESVIDGVPTQEMTKLTGSKSVDFVTRAGAGGKIVEVFESLRAVPVSEAAKSRVKEEEVKMKKVEVDESELADLRSAATERDALRATVLLQEARAREAALVVQATSVVEAALVNVAVPDVTKARLKAALVKNPPVVAGSDGVLDVVKFNAMVEESIKEEKAYIATFTATGKVDNGGTTVKEAAAKVNVEEASKALNESIGSLFNVGGR